jgi:hypothetical protein
MPSASTHDDGPRQTEPSQSCREWRCMERKLWLVWKIGVSLLSNPLLPLSPAKRKLPSRAALTKTPFRRIFISVRRKKNVAIGPTGQNDS